jgi:Tol biopolymer transport system component
MRVTSPDPKDEDFSGQYYPSFSPDGRLLAFETAKQTTGDDSYAFESEVFVLDPASGEVRSVATFTSSLLVNPRFVWSPMGDSALIVRAEGESGELAHVDVKSGDTDVLLEGRLPLSAAWAPDGSRIAYWSDDSVWLVDADGGNRSELARDAGSPTWSPDSRRLAFFRPADLTEYGDAELWLAEADGSGEKLLAKDVQHTFRSVLWSPRGDRLLFLRKAKKALGPDVGESDAYLLELKSGRVKLLARTAKPLAWSGDGKRILFARPFASTDVGTIVLYLTSAEGGDEQFVAATDEEDFNVGSYPVWQPAKTDFGPATGSFAPKKEWDFCLRKLNGFLASLR